MIAERSGVGGGESANERYREVLLERWRPFLRNLVRTNCYHSGDFDDAYQEAQLAFLYHYPRFPGGNIHGWLTVVLRGELRIYFRAKKTREDREAETLARLEHEWEPPTIDEAEVVVKIDRERWRQKLIGWISQLQPDFAATMYLCVIEGLAYRDVAERLGVPINTVKGRMNRSRKELRAILEEMLVWKSDTIEIHAP